MGNNKTKNSNFFQIVSAVLSKRERIIYFLINTVMHVYGKMYIVTITTTDRLENY